MSALLSMARWAHALSAAEAGPRIEERLRIQAASTFGAAHAGSTSDVVAPALAAARRMGTGALRVAPDARDLCLEGALFAGASLSMTHELDDWLLCAHPSHSAVWGAWLGAAELGLGWEEALRAQLAANEILGRLGGFCLGGRQHGQTWAFLHGVGGALVAGLLRGLGPDELASAMALALAQAPAVDWRLLAGGGKGISAARALVDGWRLAEIVAAGARGPVDLLDGDSDFVRLFAGGRAVRGWLQGLPADDVAATPWLTGSLTVRCAPGSIYAGAAIEATRRLLASARSVHGRDLTARDVLRVDVDCGALTAAAERKVAGNSLTPAAVTFSVRKSIAVLLVAGELGPRQLRQDWLDAHRQEILEAAGAVRLHQDWRSTSSSWRALKPTGIQALLTQLGPGPLVAAIGRTGSLEAGLALTEVPLAVAGDKLQSLPADELPALVSRGLGRLSELASRGLERLLPGIPGEPRPTPPGLDPAGLDGAAVPFPARVRVLLHGGRVHQESCEHPPGRPSDDPTRQRAETRHKLVTYARLAAPNDRAGHEALADALLGPPGGALPPLPPGGPAALLRG